MTQIVKIEPVRKSISVKASQAHAFKVFTDGLDRWWPRNGGICDSPLKTTAIEPHVGGHWYQVGENGSRFDVGTILVWEPPRRFVMSWDLNNRWKSETTLNSEVEVRFTAKGPETTLVELEHRKFERMGSEAGASMRKDVDGGWPSKLESFKQEVEA